MPESQEVKPQEAWQVAIEINTEGTIDEATALLIFYVEEVLSQRKMIVPGFEILNVSVVDIHRMGG